MSTTPFIADASVLIDYAKADRSVLALVVKHLGPVIVSDVTLAEVDQLDEDDVVELGMVLQETDLELLGEASTLARSKLSVPDRVCLLLAQRHRWICLTNDGALVRACEAVTVPVRRGLRPLIELHRGGHLPWRSAMTIAQTIQRQNPRYVTDVVMKAFRTELGPS